MDGVIVSRCARFVGCSVIPLSGSTCVYISVRIKTDVKLWGIKEILGLFRNESTNTPL